MTQDKTDGIAFRALVEPLLAWYDIHARLLPWRENPTPYRVWISEIMLQQTRVEAVKPYFERFLAELPTVEALAAASEQQLFKLWEGLGYYNRARNLQKAARVIVERHRGSFPSTHSELLELPGIGAYTAGAIASIAFGLPEPAVDGNVLRVIMRVAASRNDITDIKVREAVGAGLKPVYPIGRCSDFTQSLMELGATVCLPNGAPKCGECPLAAFCRAREMGLTAELPVKAVKKTRRIEELTVFLLRNQNRFAIRRRDEHGLLAGLWEFPAAAGQLDGAEIRRRLAVDGIVAGSVENVLCARHVFTHLQWRMTGWLIECAAPAACFDWVTLEELDRDFPLPSAFRAFTGFLRSLRH